MTHPNHPAFPAEDRWEQDGNPVPQEFPGLTKREHFAALAMQAIAGNAATGSELGRIFDPARSIADQGKESEHPHDYLARIAISLADALIAQLNKEGGAL